VSHFPPEGIIKGKGEVVLDDEQAHLLSAVRTEGRESAALGNRQLLALQSASSAITSSLDVQVVLNTVSRELVNLLAMKACVISEWKAATGTVLILARYGPDSWWKGKWAAETYELADYAWTATVLKDRQPGQLAIEGLNSDQSDLAWLWQLGIKNVLMLPMVYQDRVVGLAEVMDDRSGHALAADEMALARLLIDQAASVLENARLYDALGWHVAQATTLNKIGQVLTSILDLREALAIIADHARLLLDAATASVILYEAEIGRMWFGAASGQGSEFVRDKHLPGGNGIVDWVIQRGEPCVVQDASQDPRFFDDWDRASGLITRSILCVPLKAQDRTMGAIEAINKASGPFDYEDLTLLTSIAASAAIAIENARLFDQAQQEIAERRRAESELRRANRALRTLSECNETAKEEIHRLYQELRDHASRLESIVAERTRQLQAERDRTQAILEAVGEGVIVTDLEGRIQYLNPAAVALTGYSVKEAVGRSPKLWQGDQRSDDLYDAQPPPERLVQTQRAEVISRRRDGTLYDAAMTVAPLFDSHHQGRLVGRVCVQRDITPIKEAERLKDQFVSNVSHELRTPLSVIALISGNLDRLYDHLDDDRRRKMIRDIREHAQVLNDLIGDILEISRIESGNISTKRQTVDLAHLVREEAGRQEPLIQRKSQTLHITGPEHMVVWGNDDQLRMVVRNLLNNAIKYTPNGGQILCECSTSTVARPLQVEWPGSAGLPAGTWAAFRVADTGIGPEDLPHVYDRFYRVKTEGNIPGTGLGLSIAQELVEAHEGRIAASSTPGEGSVFAIYLPLLEE
jgi:PAS domain S-box-containing protein